MKPIQPNDFAEHWSRHREQVLAAIDAVGASGRLVLGRRVAEFERDLAAAWPLRHCVGCASGLDALEIALRCAGLRPGQRVLTTPLSAFATSLAVVRAGGVPVFVDVDASGQIDLAACAAACEDDRELRFLLPVHLYGHALDLAGLAALRDRFGLRIVEDCAQAIGARSRGAAAGSVGDFAATSFYPTKNLGALGDGGALLTDSDEGARIARELRDYGQSDRFRHVRLGLNSRLDELHAAVLGQVFLPALPEATARRRAIAQRYGAGLRNEAVAAVPAPEGSESVWHLYPVLVAGDRDGFRGHLERAGIGTGVHYPRVIPDQPALAEIVAAAPPGPLHRARRFAESEVSLPIHPYLSDEDVDRVIHACNAWQP